MKNCSYGEILKFTKSGKAVKFVSETRVPAGWFFFILVLLMGTLQKIWGISLVLIGEVFRTIAAGTITKNERLTTHGIYQFIRHPLYFGSFCIATGLCLICNNAFIWIYFIVFYPAAYTAAILIEENWLKTKFGDSFLNYKKNVPAFIPFRIKNFSDWGDFSWMLVFKNKEHHNWLIILAVLTVLILKTH